MEQARAIRRRLLVLALVAVAAMQLMALLTWALRFGGSVGEDFDAHWAAMRLLLTGHRDAMYSLPAQLAAVHAAGLPTAQGLNHPGWGPVGLLSVAPFTLFPDPVAVLLWTLLQLGALSAAMTLVVRDGSAEHIHLAPLAALVTPGLAALVVLGQWEGLAALLLVLAWLDGRRGRRVRAAVWLLLLVGALPQLAVGLLVFQCARRGWPQVGTLAAGGAVLAGGALALLGAPALQGWWQQVDALNREVRTTGTIGLPGLVADLVPGGTARLLLSGIAVSAALAGCAWLARRPALPQPATARVALAAATLSLLVSPHLFQYGLVALSPLLVATVLAERRLHRRAALALLWAALDILDVAALHLQDVPWLVVFPLGLLGLAGLAVAPLPRRRLDPALREEAA